MESAGNGTTSSQSGGGGGGVFNFPFAQTLLGAFAFTLWQRAAKSIMMKKVAKLVATNLGRDAFTQSMVAFVIFLCVVYLLNVVFGKPYLDVMNDSLPFVGHLDDFLVMFVLVQALFYFNIDATIIFGLYSGKPIKVLINLIKKAPRTLVGGHHLELSLTQRRAELAKQKAKAVTVQSIESLAVKAVEVTLHSQRVSEKEEDISFTTFEVIEYYFELFVDILILFLGLYTFAYCLNLIDVEIIPDHIPFLGKLDEMLSFSILVECLKHIFPKLFGDLADNVPETVLQIVVEKTLKWADGVLSMLIPQNPHHPEEAKTSSSSPPPIPRPILSNIKTKTS